jgi:hypothetical protein
MNQMTSTLNKGFSIVLAAGTLAAAVLVGTPAKAQYVTVVPSEYVAVTAPVYYNGSTGATRTAGGATTTTSRTT